MNENCDPNKSEMFGRDEDVDVGEKEDLGTFTCNRHVFFS